LRFNQEQFCDGDKAYRKTLWIAVPVSSGALFEGRVASGSAGEPAFGSSGRSSAGFRWLGGRAQMHQKRRNGAVDPDRRQATGVVAALPGQPQVRNARSGQPELGESGQNQPRPAVGLLGAAHPRRRPSERLLEEAEGVLQVEAPDVGAPDEVQIRLGSLRPAPPQPQHPRLAPPLATSRHGAAARPRPG